MKHILQVLKFEYIGCVKTKSFIISTIIFMMLIILMTFLPGIILAAQSSGEPAEDVKKPVLAVCDQAYGQSEMMQEELKNGYPQYELKMTEEDREVLKQKVDQGDYAFAVVLEKPLSFIYITKNNQLMGNPTEQFGTVLKRVYEIDSFEKLGISYEKSREIFDAQATVSTITTGTDQTKNFWSTYILMMILYMAIVMYGQMVSQSVVSEKNTRAMEMLITCAKPSHLMFGKVIGSGLAGLTQMVIIIATALASMSSVSSDILPDQIKEFLSFQPESICYALLFFLLGYFIYSFLLGALSSLASRSEDLNTLIAPVMILVVAAFMIVMLAVNSGTLDSPLMIVSSYIPFTAPIAMFARVTLSDVALWQVLISVGIQLLSVYLIGMLAAAIYRIGVLMYGKAPRPSALIKLLREQHKTNRAVKEANRNRSK